MVLIYYMATGGGGVEQPINNNDNKWNSSVIIVEFLALVSLVMFYGVLVLTIWMQEVIANQEVAWEEKDNGTEKDEYDLIEYVFVC